MLWMVLRWWAHDGPGNAHRQEPPVPHLYERAGTGHVAGPGPITAVTAVTAITVPHLCDVACDVTIVIVVMVY